ncbi:MAG: Mur ligase domain-containing protein, partial [Candidatus Puniceispirillaceae bacterium]
MHLSDLLTYLPSAELVTGTPDQIINSVSANSASVTAGAVFAALAGSKQDGHNFIEDALKAGATAILSDRASLSLPEGIAHIRSAEPRRDYALIC